MNASCSYSTILYMVVFIVTLPAQIWGSAVVNSITLQNHHSKTPTAIINYTVSSSENDTDLYLNFYGINTTNNMAIPPYALHGEGVKTVTVLKGGKTLYQIGPVKPGKHTLIWEINPAELSLYTSDSFEVRMDAYSHQNLYLLIDISEGPEARRYPTRFSSCLPTPIPDEYRTKIIALRYIPSGAFVMGSPATTWEREISNQHSVVLTQNFYIGIFEITQQQWKLVMGSNPSTYPGETHPIETVSYNTIRGSNKGARFPEHNYVDSTSFMGKLRSRTKLNFDLPTAAQWEYACRAGTTTSLNSGKNLTAPLKCPNMHEVGRYSYNRKHEEHAKVGSYAKNAWGLYDMHGNVFEWCLDLYAISTISPVVDPLGPHKGLKRITRGGSCRSDADLCRAGYITGDYPEYSRFHLGFRLALPLMSGN